MTRNAVVHKFLLNPPSDPVGMTTEVMMPSGAKLLSIGVQGGRDAVIWAQVDPKEELMVPRRFQVVPTGIPFEARASSTYITTFQIDDPRFFGKLWFHVFEVL